MRRNKIFCFLISTPFQESNADKLFYNTGSCSRCAKSFPLSFIWDFITACLFHGRKKCIFCIGFWRCGLPWFHRSFINCNCIACLKIQNNNSAILIRILIFGISYTSPSGISYIFPFKRIGFPKATDFCNSFLIFARS